MRLHNIFIFLLLLLCPHVVFSQQQGADPFAGIDFKSGPFTASLCGMASVNVPAGYLFVEKKDVKKFQDVIHNITSGSECGIVISDTGSRFAVFSYIPSGHILDDEKGNLNPNEIMATLKRNTDKSNVERKNRGWGEMTLIGWEVTPHYDQLTNNLEWGIRGVSEGETVINYNIRLLGREGLMTVVCVDNPENFKQSLYEFRKIVSNFGFKTGEKYAEYRQGDKLAQYGLSALIVGGAAAVAVKSGIGKWLGKIIGFGVLAAVGYIVSLFKRKK